MISPNSENSLTNGLKNMTRLIRPSIKYKTSFLKALQEFQREGRNLDLNYKEIAENFSKFVRERKNRALGLDLPKGFVPESIFWLVNRGEYIGRLSIRHRLNDHLKKIGGHIGYEIRPTKRKRGYGREILRLGLLKAKKLGIKNALLTCDFDNVGSRKIIQGNGGVFENRAMNPKGKDKLKFWIKVK